MLKQKNQPVTRFGGPRGGNILECYIEDFRPQPSPLEEFRQHIIEWFFAVKHLRRFEVGNLTDSPLREDLDSHRLICSTLITFGEFAAKFARENKNVNLDSLGLTVEAIEVEIRLLRDSFKIFHDDTMSLSEANKILEEAFA